MLTSETKRRIDACRDILVGKLPLPTDQVELITLALIYKFMDDLDEESVAMGGKRSFFIKALAPYRWRAITAQTVSADERMALFADGLEILGGSKKLRDEKLKKDVDIAAHLPALFRDIFRNAFLKFRDGRTLSLFLTELSGFAYSHSEELGNAFEYILQCMGAQGDNGQFRTPRHVIDFMVACLEPKLTDKVLDPACGTGGFLVSAFKHILHQHTTPGSSVPGDRLSHNQREQLFAHFAGYDINDQMVKLSRVNLFLHQFATPTIHIYDTLTNDARWHEKADLILANPPFMTPKGGVVPHTKFRVPAKKSEFLYTDYIAEHLTPDGRAGVIVPNGIVATTQTAYVKLRRFLVEDSLVAVVSLPAGCFKPYSGVKTSILLLDKKLARTTDKILFLKIAADGFDLGDKRNEIEANDLPEAQRVVRAWMTGKLGDNFATPLAWRLVAKRELLADKHHQLNPDRFFGSIESTNSDHPMVPLGEICTFLNGRAFKAVEWQGPESGGLPIIRIQNLNNYGGAHNYFVGEVAEKNLIETGELLFSWAGSKGTSFGAHIWKGPRAALNQHIFKVQFDAQRAIKPYLLYALNKSVAEVEENLHGGVGLVHITKGNLESIEIPLPPLEEQRRIVAEIESYQQVIDGARQILSAYRSRFEIDPSWPVVPLGSIFKLTSGKFLPGKTREAGAHPVYGGNGIMGHHNEYFLENETLVIGRVGAYCGAVHLTQPKSWITDNALYVVEWLQKVNQRFISHAVRDANLNRYAKQGGQPYISQSIVAEVEIPLPPLPEQTRIVAELDAEAARIEAVRGLIPAFEAKIHRVLARVWGNTIA